MNRIRTGVFLLTALLLALGVPRLSFAQQDIVSDSGIIDLNNICHPGGVGQDDGCSLEAFAVIYADTNSTNLHTLSQTSVSLDSFDDGFNAFVCTKITRGGTTVLAQGCFGDNGQGVAYAIGNIPISLSGGPYSFAVDTNSYFDFYPGCEGGGTCYNIVNPSVNVTLGDPVITSTSPPYLFVGTSGVLAINGNSLINPFPGAPATQFQASKSGGTGFTTSGASFGVMQGTANYQVALTATTGNWDLGVSYFLGNTDLVFVDGSFVIGDPTPSIASVSPNNWNAGQANIAVTITGSGFGSNPQLIVGSGVTSTITSHTDNGQPNGAQIQANVTVPICASGVTAITVTSAGYNGSGFGAAYPGQASTGTSSATIQPITDTISLSRQSLVAVQATGTPNGGAFSYNVTPITGTSLAAIQFATGVTSTTNPNTTNLTNPPNPNKNGAPAPGGLASIGATYSQCGAATHSFQVPTFGMSCYYTTLQSDWGTVPSNCKIVTIKGVVYSGTITNPYGLSGTYCSSFIAEVKLQGSGVLTSGQDIQYDPSTNKITKVSQINGADGTPVVANKTVARSRSIIPIGGVHVDIDLIGTNLLANDTGGDIVGYRIDLYRGAGSAVCTNYKNIISVSACNPGNSKCPARAIQ